MEELKTPIVSKNAISLLLAKCNLISNCPADDIYKKLIENNGISNQHLYVKKSSITNAGLGVFTKKDLYPQDAIEYCHSIVLNWRTSYPLEPNIGRYVYSFPCDCNDCQKYGRKLLLPLGYGSIYNTTLNQNDANAEWYINLDLSLQIFVCRKPIKAGEEIFVYYGDNYVKAFNLK